jgi:hypothetical protein
MTKGSLAARNVRREGASNRSRGGCAPRKFKGTLRETGAAFFLAVSVTTATFPLAMVSIGLPRQFNTTFIAVIGLKNAEFDPKSWGLGEFFT